VFGCSPGVTLTVDEWCFGSSVELRHALPSQDFFFDDIGTVETDDAMLGGEIQFLAIDIR